MKTNARAAALVGAALIALSVAPKPVHAFEAWEHRRLGELAFHLAMRLHCPGDRLASGDCAKVARWFANPLEPRERWPGSPRALNYGILVQCVDFFLTPEKMLAGHEDVLFDRAPASGAPAPKNEEGILARSAEEYGRIQFSEHCDDSLFNTSSLQATHSNHAHFQAELVASQHLHHAQAVAARRPPRSNLFGALLINAIADHYLHDFFAPGHVGTFRSHMSDIYSNALHDSINASGAKLRFTREAFEKLLGNLDRHSPARLGEVAIDEPAVRRALQCASPDAATFLRPLPPTTCIQPHAPEPTREPCWLQGVRDLGTLLRKVVSNEPGCDAPGWDEGIVLNGDNMLWRQGQWRQRLLMLAMQMQSILEVLRADEHGHEPSAFAGAYWRTRALPNEGGAMIEASLDGVFNYRLRFLSFDQLTLLPWRARRRLPDEAQQDVIEIAGHQPDYLWLRPKAQRQLVLSGGINYEMPRFGQRLSRTSASLEMPVLGFLTLQGKLNVGTAVGALWFRESRGEGWGLSVRPGIVFTQTETFLSVPLRWLRTSGMGDEAWRTSWGIRLDQGFSSFMTVYMQLNNSAFVQAQGERRYERGSAFGAGVVLAAPLCRIPLVSKLCD